MLIIQHIRGWVQEDCVFGSNQGYIERSYHKILKTIPILGRLKQEDCDFKVSLGKGMGKKGKKEARSVENVNRS